MSILSSDCIDLTLFDMTTEKFHIPRQAFDK